jgi:hypothetical protein
MGRLLLLTSIITTNLDARLKSPPDVRQRPGAPVKQTIELGVRASEDKTREPAT